MAPDVYPSLCPTFLRAASPHGTLHPSGALAPVQLVGRAEGAPLVLYLSQRATEPLKLVTAQEGSPLTASGIGEATPPGPRPLS